MRWCGARSGGRISCWLRRARPACITAGMSGRLAASLLVAVTACSGDKPAPGKAAPPPARDAAPAAPSPTAEVPRLPPAPPASPPTADDCKLTGDHVRPVWKIVAADRAVPDARLDAAVDGLARAFAEACAGDGWGTGLLDCLGKNPLELDTYYRCFMRLPLKARTTWNDRVDQAIGAAGGTTKPTPPPAEGEGDLLEQVCPAFFDELARLDDCMSPGSYSPDLERALRDLRMAAPGGRVPADNLPAVRAQCEQGVVLAREVGATVCAHLLRAP